MTVWATTIGDRQFEFDMSGPHFSFAWDGLNYWKLCLFIVRETQFPNWIWMRIITLGLHWPPIKTEGGFTDPDEFFEEIRNE
jgi:hypothetical protein